MSNLADSTYPAPQLFVCTTEELCLDAPLSKRLPIGRIDPRISFSTPNLFLDPLAGTDQLGVVAKGWNTFTRPLYAAFTFAAALIRNGLADQRLSWSWSNALEHDFKPFLGAGFFLLHFHSAKVAGSFRKLCPRVMPWYCTCQSFRPCFASSHCRSWNTLRSPCACERIG